MSEQAVFEPGMVLVWTVCCSSSVASCSRPSRRSGADASEPGTGRDSAASFSPQATWLGLAMLAAEIVCFLAATAF